MPGNTLTARLGTGFVRPRLLPRAASVHRVLGLVPPTPTQGPVLAHPARGLHRKRSLEFRRVLDPFRKKAWRLLGKCFGVHFSSGVYFALFSILHGASHEPACAWM